MSHLLSTVNPEAADAIQPAPARQPLPGVGETVVYTMRPGYARSGRTRFPAVVMGGDRGVLDLLVMIDAGDMNDEQMVPEAGPGQEFHCWERVAPTAVPGIHGTVAALHERIGKLEDEFKAIRDTVLGDFEPPAVSIIHIMQDFENRLRALKQAAAPAAAPKAKRGRK
jgi:hypothetical protein